jgi:hypothetical protein
MTNCYVVAPNGELGFKVSRAFVYESDALTDKLRVDAQNTYTGKFGVEIVWETEKVIHSLVVEGSGKDAVVSLYTYNTEGNAVVKIYKTGDTSKTALWSWHIWVTSYDPTNDAGWNPKANGGNTTRENVLFMDRNLGALAAENSLAGRGLHYQWGRKDPFPLKDVSGFGIADGGSGVTIVQAIQNPGTFYYIVSGNDDDWLADGRDNSLWGGDAEAKPKTIYDPCPAGWRVPLSGASNSSPWSGYNTHGYITGDGGGIVLGTTQSYWPAAGYRNRNTGALTWPGTLSDYGSATVSGIGAYGLAFHSSDFWPSYTHGRATGVSERCVKEIPRVIINPNPDSGLGTEWGQE